MSKFIPFAALILSVVVVAFLAGAITTHFKVFPYHHLRNAHVATTALIDVLSTPKRIYFIETTEIPANEAADARWTIVDKSAPRLPVIAYGGRDQYLELCPDHGCLAVAFDGDGNVSEAWPYRPNKIFAIDITEGAYPHESVFFEPRRQVHPISVRRYSNGDVLASFQAVNGVFPFAVGVARIGPDGLPRWTRFDYSHHWSTMGADEVAYIPALKVGDQSIRFSHGSPPSPRQHVLACDSDRPQLDVVQIIDGAGRLLDEIELVPIFLRPNWAGLLPETTDNCDPLHLNYVDKVGEDAGEGLAPGDLVLSLRNLSRFAILDPVSRTIKRVVAGGFVQQHSVHHLSGTRFLIFDNRGGDRWGPASRIVELDLATGVERRIFPNASTPAEFATLFSDTAGHLELSPDRSRVMASFTYVGRAFEVDIETGRLLSIYDNVHDNSSLEGVPAETRDRAARFALRGVGYLR